MTLRTGVYSDIEVESMLSLVDPRGRDVEHRYHPLLPPPPHHPFPSPQSTEPDWNPLLLDYLIPNCESDFLLKVCQCNIFPHRPSSQRPVDSNTNAQLQVLNSNHDFVWKITNQVQEYKIVISILPEYWDIRHTK